MAAIEWIQAMPSSRSTRVVRRAWVAASACLLIILGADGYSRKSRSQTRMSVSAWAAPVLVAAIFTSTSLDRDPILPERPPSSAGLLSAAGSPILIATIVHAKVLKEIGVSRIGGLYGP